MEFLKIDSKEVKNTAKSLFLFKKQGIMFLILIYIIPILLTYFIYMDKLDFAILQNHADVLFSVYFVLGILIYKSLAKSTEFDVYRVSFQFVLVLAVFSMLSLAFILPSSQHPIMLIFSELFSQISFIIAYSFLLIGLVYLIFQRKFHIKQIILIYIISLFITVVSNVSTFYQKGFSLIELFSIKAFIVSVGGIFVFYAYNQIKKYFMFRNKALTFFPLFGLIIFFLEYANGLFGTPAWIPLTKGVGFLLLFLVNIEPFIYYLLWGVFLHIYDKPKV